MTKSIYVGLPVTNLDLSTRFYEALGLVKEAAFSDKTTSTMVWSDSITFQLQTHDRFKSWVSKEIVAARTTAGVLITLTQDARQAVDAMVAAAAQAGGKAGDRAPIDLGWLYNRSFEDPDGHMLEAVWFETKNPAEM